MIRASFKLGLGLGYLLLSCCLTPIRPQNSPSSSLVESGHVDVAGHSTPYLIRRLPVSSFPQLPPSVQDLLNRRGCLIPQTYEAHAPENVVHASLERHGSSDWAVLCSVNGTVSLLVFFSSSSGDPIVLATSPETGHLQARNSTDVLGFNWGIDAASPDDVHQAQLGMRSLPPRLDHDALADSVIDHKTIYHLYSRNTWALVDTQN